MIAVLASTAYAASRTFMPDRLAPGSSGSATPGRNCAGSDGELRNACPTRRGRRARPRRAADPAGRPEPRRTARSRSSPWVHGGPDARYADEFYRLARTPRAVARGGGIRGLPAQPARRPGSRPGVRGGGRGLGRQRRVDRHPGRDRPADRRRGRGPGPARHRRLEPRRVHGRVGDRADRPVQGRADGRRDQRLGNASRDRRGWAPVEAALGGSCGWEGHGPHRARPAQPDLVSPRRSAPRS